MADVIELKADERPPKGADWALVAVLPDEHLPEGPAVVRHNMGATFYTAAAQSEVTRAITRATTWADAHSIDNVYVQRIWAGRK